MFEPTHLLADPRLGRELRAYNFSHSTSPFFVKGFFKIKSLTNYLPGAGFEP
jgi:hypothetical protein